MFENVGMPVKLVDYQKAKESIKKRSFAFYQNQIQSADDFDKHSVKKKVRGM